MGVFEKLNELAGSLYTQKEEFIDYIRAAYYGYNLRQHTFGGEALAGTCALSVGLSLLALAYETGTSHLYVIGGTATAAGIISIIDDVLFNKGLLFYIAGIPKDMYIEARKNTCDLNT